MKRIDNRGPIGIVLRTADHSRKPGIDIMWRENVSAHFVLNRFKVDDDGRICLTADLTLDELRGAVDLFKAQLDALLDQISPRPSAQ